MHLFPNLLSFFTSKKIILYHYLIKLFAQEIFSIITKKSYYSKRLLRAESALRYQYFGFRSKENNLKSNYIILVPLPIETEMNLNF